MRNATITTELVRQLRHQAPAEVTDFRDPKLPGFVLRARPTGIHSWRVQLPNRRWLTIGRIDEVALSDARETAQTRRAQAAVPTKNSSWRYSGLATDYLDDATESVEESDTWFDFRNRGTSMTVPCLDHRRFCSSGDSRARQVVPAAASGSSRVAFVPVMKAADLRDRNNAAADGHSDRTRNRRVLIER